MVVLVAVMPQSAAASAVPARNFLGVVLHRMVLHVAPLAAFWAAVMLGEAIKKPVEETSTG